MQLHKFLHSAALAAVLAAPVCADDSLPLTSPAGHATGRLIVELSADSDHDAGLGALQGDVKTTDSIDHQRWAAQHGMQHVRGISRRTYLMQHLNSATGKQNLGYIARKLSASDSVVRASVEYKRYPLLEPNDPLYLGNGQEPGSQSYLYEGTYSLRAPGAWDITTGASSSVIAVVDTGVLENHPDLSNRSIPGSGYDFVAADRPGDFTSANDGDGRDDNPADPGDHCSANPSSWHGTAVASVAAGTGNNAEGIAGIDWNARLLHARALGRCGGTDADIIDAIRWSAGLPVSGLPVNETPATVVNLSFGGPTECTPAWQNVIDELNSLGIPFVIAAGNESNNALRSSPANCANVITVGSNAPDGDIDRFSNYGLKVTIAAPGRDILLATNDGLQDPDALGFSYKRETGSSFSAAIVSGAISLMQSLNANLSPSQVSAILQQSASPFSTEDECGSYYCGSGILNLIRAMQLARDGGFNESQSSEAQVIASQLSRMQLGTSVNGALFGYRDIRYYELEVDQSGMLEIVSDSTADLFGYLLNDKFSVLALNDDEGNALNFRVAARVEPGTYYLAVEREAHRFNDGEATYTLTPSLTQNQPDPFTFPPKTNVQRSSEITSQTIQLTGLENGAVISVAGGFYSVNGRPVTNAQGEVFNGDSISVSLQAPPAANSTNSVTLTVGAYSTGFSVTTASSDDAVETHTPSGSDTSPSNPGSNGSGGCTLRTAASGSADISLLLMLLLAGFAVTSRPRQTKHTL